MIEYRDLKSCTLRHRLSEMRNPYKEHEQIWRRSSIKGKRQINKAKRRRHLRKGRNPLKASRKKFRAFYFSSLKNVSLLPHPFDFFFFQNRQTIFKSVSLPLVKSCIPDFLAIFLSSKILFYFPTDFSVF